MQKITTTRGVVLGGLWSGLMAGSAMALFLMVLSALSGSGFWKPMQLIAGSFYGNGAESAGATTAAVGLLFHLFNSAAIGLIFAAFVRYSTEIAALLIGMGMALGIWVITTFVAVPLLDPPLWRVLGYASFPWFFAHVVFGGVLMITPTMVSRYSESTQLAEHADFTEHRRAA